MKAIIADDEPELRNRLHQSLLRVWPDLEIVAQAADGTTALEAIRTHTPDVVFLDIRMPGMSGLKVAKQILGQCHIVFVTAYDQYAVEAFEQNAVDYLLKPYTDDRLQKTVARIQAQTTAPSKQDGLEDILQRLEANLSQNVSPVQWLRASIADDTFLIHVDDISYFESDTKYTSIHTREREYQIRTPLKELEQQLDPSQFWRIHRGIIVNLRYIDKAKRLLDGRYLLYLKHSDQELTVSRSYAHLFRQM